MVSDIVRADAELENNIRPRSAQRIYGRISTRPEMLCSCIGTGWADAELE